MKKKILIVSNFFYPEITPRAFRVKELAVAFCEKGYQVDVLIPNKDIYRDNPFQNIEGLTINYADEPLRVIKKSGFSNIETKNNLATYLFEKFKLIFFYFFPRELYQTYNKGITKVLKKSNGNYLAVISISQPLSIHLSVIIAMLSNRKLRNTVTIAEFSDPLFKGNYKNVFPANYLFGFLFSVFFRYFVVPVSQAKIKFQDFKLKNIVVIPQGFNFTNVKVKKYIKNDVVTFAYAGNFYSKLRDPTYFLEELTTIDTKFVFKIYLSKTNLFYRKLIEGYRNRIRGDIEILDYIPRERLIYELSGIDFLLNFDNENESMSPSKLIDYALTQRPILSFNSKTFNILDLKNFLNGDYCNKVNIELEKYSIERIIIKYEELFYKKKDNKL